MKLVYTIKKSDVGKGEVSSSKRCKCCGTLLFAQHIKVRDFMGTIQPQDVGKRIYFAGNSYQIESNEQLAKKRL